MVVRQVCSLDASPLIHLLGSSEKNGDASFLNDSEDHLTILLQFPVDESDLPFLEDGSLELELEVDVDVVSNVFLSLTTVLDERPLIENCKKVRLARAAKNLRRAR